MIADLPPSDPVRAYGMQRLADLDRLGQATGKGDETATEATGRLRSRSGGAAYRGQTRPRPPSA